MISVQKQIVVETSQQRAFRTFTDGIDRWWPREHHIGTSPLERMVIEPRASGRWYSICQDGSEVDIGKVVAWEPPSRLVLTSGGYPKNSWSIALRNASSPTALRCAYSALASSPAT